MVVKRIFWSPTAALPLISCGAPSCLGPLICQVGIIIMPPSYGCYEDERAGHMVSLREY